MRSCVRDYRRNIGVEKGESMAEHFKYEEMTDEELIDQLREGDRQVMDYICDKYKIWCEARQNPCIFWAETAKI